MEQINQIRKDPSATNTVSLISNRADVWAYKGVQEVPHNIRKSVEDIQLEKNQQLLGNKRARKVYLRLYYHACDQFKRADRDLGETAAFIAASLTTVTAVQAVISVAKDKIELSKEVLQFAFQGYIAIFILILLLGALRAKNAIRRRAKAERNIDQAKKGIFEFCPMDQWPKLEE